jgi:hypothetical protein
MLRHLANILPVFVLWEAHYVENPIKNRKKKHLIKKRPKGLICQGAVFLYNNNSHARSEP